jgi:hypothetical protein
MTAMELLGLIFILSIVGAFIRYGIPILFKLSIFAIKMSLTAFVAIGAILVIAQAIN